MSGIPGIVDVIRSYRKQVIHESGHPARLFLLSSQRCFHVHQTAASQATKAGVKNPEDGRCSHVITGIVNNGPALLCVASLQDALASFDFLNKRNSIAVKPDLDRVVEQEIQHPDLELTAIQKDAEIRCERHAPVSFVSLLKLVNAAPWL